jgi:two-component sensor histidine kinase
VRSDWEAQQPQAIQDLLETNRLRINNLTRVFTPLAMLADTMTWSPVQTPFLFELRSQLEQTADKISAQRNETTRIPFVATEKAAELGITVEELAYRGFPADEKGLIYLAKNDDSKGYDSLTIEQKIALVQEVTAVCVQILEVFGYNVTAKK